MLNDTNQHASLARQQQARVAEMAEAKQAKAAMYALTRQRRKHRLRALLLAVIGRRPERGVTGEGHRS